MAQVISGASLGIFDALLNQLLGRGPGGSPVLGQYSDRVYVNAATGNLVVRQQDELLFSSGADLNLIRTYNSQGLLDDDNGDNWRLSVHRAVQNLTGTVNQTGSTVDKVFGDAAAVTYTYDGALGLYVSTDGDGAHDTLSYAASEWTWTDGSARITEAYDSNGVLISLADTDGHTQSFTYGAGLLTQVTLTDVETSTVQTTYLDYDVNNNLEKVRVEWNVSGVVTETRTRYAYDASDRLITVTVDLSPDDNLVVDGKTWVTSYTYDGTSNRIATIKDGDGNGSQVTFGYTEVATDDWRVTSVTDGEGNLTTYAYDTVNDETAVTNALGHTTTYKYDTDGQLTDVVSPALSGGSLTTVFAYDGDGNLTSVTNGDGEVTTYIYDTSGNLKEERDYAGRLVERTYTATNQLASETVYTDFDTDGAGPLTPSQGRITHFVYDTEEHLRFVVGPEGEVLEHRYAADGTRSTTVAFTAADDPYDGLTYMETDLSTWTGHSERDLTQTQRTDFTYDFRGQLATQTTYTSVDATGAGVVDQTERLTQYVYDSRGNLLTRIDAWDVAGSHTETSVYDGVGRLESIQDAIGTTTVDYQTSAITTGLVRITTLANGLVQKSHFDLVGRHLAEIATGSGATVSSTNAYDDAGRLRMVTDEDGNQSHRIYDDADRLVGTIDVSGYLAELVYDGAGRIVKTLRYATALSQTQIDSLLDVNGDPADVALSTLRPTTHVDDRVSYTVYDDSGLEVLTLDASGHATALTYGGNGLLIETRGYATAATLEAGFEGGWQLADVTLTADAINDRVTRFFHDDAGRETGSLDSEGYLVGHKYDGAGQLIETLGYATQTDPQYHATGTLDDLRPAADADHDQLVRHFYDARGNRAATLDADGYLRHWTFDNTGKRTEMAYADVPTGVDLTTAPLSALLTPLASSDVRVTTWTYTARGDVASTVNPEGIETRFTYDAVGNLIETTRAFGTTATRTLTKAYDAHGRLTGELSAKGKAALDALPVPPDQEDINDVWANYGIAHVYSQTSDLRLTTTDAQGNTTWFFYDEHDRLRYTANARGEVTERRYNGFGEVKERIDYAIRITPGNLTIGDILSVESELTAHADDRVTQTQYSLRGQIKQILDGTNRASDRSYNAFGELSSEQSELTPTQTRTRVFTYDTLGQLETESITNIGTREARTYDAFGRIDKLTDGNGNETTFTYDRPGQIVTTIDDSGQTVTAYDAFARVVSQTDALLQVTTTAYDDTARSITVTTPEGVITTTVRNEHGEQATITDGEGRTTTFTYDLDGNLTNVFDGIGTAVDDYDNSGRLIESTDANGNVTTFAYDAVNRLATRTVDPQPQNPTGLNLVTQYIFNAFGEAITVTDPNGNVTQTAYDDNGNVLTVTVDPGAGNLDIKTQFSRDAEGRMLTVTEGFGSTTPRETTFVYDDAGRRISETRDPSGLALLTTYTYDGNDNVRSRSVGNDPDTRITRYVYDATNNLVYIIEGVGRIVDENNPPNLIDGDGTVTQFVYDAEERLVKTIEHSRQVTVSVTPTVAELEALLDPELAVSFSTDSYFNPVQPYVYSPTATLDTRPPESKTVTVDSVQQYQTITQSSSVKSYGIYYSTTSRKVFNKASGVGMSLANGTATHVDDTPSKVTSTLYLLNHATGVYNYYSANTMITGQQSGSAYWFTPYAASGWNGSVPLKSTGSLPAGSYKVVIQTRDDYTGTTTLKEMATNGSVVDSSWVRNTTVYINVGTQNLPDHIDTTISWANDVEPANTSTREFRYRAQGSTDPWVNLTVTVNGANHEVFIDQAVDGNYEYEIFYKDAAGAVLKSTESGFTISGAGNALHSADFYAQPITSATTGSSILAYIDAADFSSIDYVEAKVYDAGTTTLVSTAKTYPAAHSAYAGEVNLSTGGVLADSAYEVEITRYLTDETTVVDEKFFYEVGTTTVITAANAGTLRSTPWQIYNYQSTSTLDQPGSQSENRTVTLDTTQQYANYTQSSIVRNNRWAYNTTNNTIYSTTGTSIVVGSSGFWNDTTPTLVRGWIYNQDGTLHSSLSSTPGQGSTGSPYAWYWQGATNWAGHVNLSNAAVPEGIYDILVDIQDDYDNSTAAPNKDSVDGKWDPAPKWIYDVVVGNPSYADHLDTKISWDVATQPAEATSVEFRYREVGEQTWIDLTVATSGNDQEVIIDHSVDGNYEYEVTYKGAFNNVVKSTAGTFTLSGIAQTSHTASFLFGAPTATAASGSSITGYIDATEAASTDYMIAEVKDLETGAVVSTATTYPSAHGTYNGELNLSVNEAVPTGQYTVEVTKYYLAGTTATDDFYYEVGTFPTRTNKTNVGWSGVEQPGGTSAVVKYRIDDPQASWQTIAPAYDELTQDYTALFDDLDDGVYQYMVEYTDPSGTLTFVSEGTFTVAQDTSSTETNDFDDEIPEQITYTVYDADGRDQYGVDALGYVTERIYNDADQVTQSTAYATALTELQLEALAEAQPVDRASLVAGWIAIAPLSDQTTYIVYDTAGRSVGVVDAAGYLTEQMRDAGGRVTDTIEYGTVVDNLGATTLAGLWAAGAPATGNHVTRANYDAADRVIAEVDPGGYLREYTYDDNGNRIKATAYANVVNPGTFTASSTSTDDRVSRAYYDNADRLTHELDAGGYLTAYDRNLHGEATRTIAYADTAIPAPLDDTTVPVAAAGDDRISYAVYDAVGQMVWELDALGYATNNAYDIHGNLAQIDQYATAPILVNDAYEDAVTKTELKASWLTTYVSTSTDDRTTHILYDAAGQERYRLNAENYLTVYTRDVFGRVVEERQISVTFVRDPLLTITDDIEAFVADDANWSHTENRIARFAYDVRDQVVHEARELGAALAQTLYQYDAFGNQMAIVGPRGAELAYGNSPWALSERAFLEYTATELDATGAEITRAKWADELDSIEQADLLSLYTTTQTFDTLNRKIGYRDPIGNTVDTSYDAFGNIVSTTDGNSSTGYFFYDANDRITLSVDPIGGAETSTYNAFGDVTAVTRYGNKVVNLNEVASDTPPSIVTTAPGSGPYILEDSAIDQTTASVYDGLGRRVSETDALGNSEQVLEFDAFGNVLQMQDKRGNVYEREFDKLNQVTVEKTPTLTYYTDVETSTTATGTIDTTHIYDAFGNRTATTQAATTTFEYDALDRNVKEIHPSVVTYARDPGTGDFIAQSTASPTIEREYDVSGNLIRELGLNGFNSYSFYDPGNRLTASVDAFGALVIYDYDAAGNLIATESYQQPLPLTGTEAWNAIPALIDAMFADEVDDGFRERTYRYDAANNLIAELKGTALHFDSQHEGLIFAPAATLYEYDGNGNRTKVVDGNGNETVHVYDAVGNRIATFETAGYVATLIYYYVTTFIYDASSNVVEQYRYATATTPGTMTILATSSDDRKTTYVYDPMNRLVEERVHDVAHASVSNTDGAVTSYDAASNHDKVTSQTYDANGSLTRAVVQVKDGETVVIGTEDREQDFTYDALDRRVALIGSAFTAEIDAALHTTQTVRATTSFGYDALGREVISTEEAIAGSTGDYAISRSTLTVHNAAGHTTKTVDREGNETIYGIDFAGNVVFEEWDQSAIQSWTGADPVLNATPTTYRTEYDYDALNRVIATHAPEDVTTGTQYNAHGEIIGEGRWASTASPDYQTQYVYNDIGNLVYTNERNGTPRRYAYDLAGNVTLELNSSGEELALPDVTQTQLANQLALEADPNAIVPVLKNLQQVFEDMGGPNVGNIQLFFNYYDERNLLVKVGEPTIDVEDVTTEISEVTNTTTYSPFAFGSNLKSSGYSKATITHDIRVARKRWGSGSYVRQMIFPTVTVKWGRLHDTIDTGRIRIKWDAQVGYAYYWNAYPQNFIPVDFSYTGVLSTGATTVVWQAPQYYYSTGAQFPAGNARQAPPNDYQISFERESSWGSGYTMRWQNQNGDYDGKYVQYAAGKSWGVPPTYTFTESFILTEPTLKFINQPDDGALFELDVTNVKAGSQTQTFQLAEVDDPTGPNNSTYVLDISRNAASANYLASGQNYTYEYNMYDGIGPLNGGKGDIINRGRGSINISGAPAATQATSPYPWMWWFTPTWKAVGPPAYSKVSVSHASMAKDDDEWTSYESFLADPSNPALQIRVERENTYSAFGEVVSEIGGNGNVTDFVYDAGGSLLTKTDPQVEVWDAAAISSGTGTLTRPVTEYHYNVHGETVAVTDARDFTSSQVMENGLARYTFTPDDGAVEHLYNGFGNKVGETRARDVANFSNPNTAGWTYYEYDKEHRLTKLTRPSDAYEEYAYDERDNRIGRKVVYGDLNGHDGINTASTTSYLETYQYNSQAQITQHVSFGGLITSYGYSYYADISDLTGVGTNPTALAIAGIAGWQLETTRSDDNKRYDRYDFWGNQHFKKDYGSHQFVYEYNHAGWLSRQQGDEQGANGETQDIDYYYYNNGYLKLIVDHAVNRTTYYGYDDNGNRAWEKISDAANSPLVTNDEHYQATEATYDALNRITSLTDPRYTVNYRYDEVGNRINVNAVHNYYLDTDNGTNIQLAVPVTQDFWYAYDEVNRFTTTMGERTGGAVVKGTSGYDITYFHDGNRASSTKAYDGTSNVFANKEIQQTYSYNADGYLTETLIESRANGSTDPFVRMDRTLRELNHAGQTLRYTEYGANNTIINNQTEYKYNSDHLKLWEYTVPQTAGNHIDSIEFEYFANSREIEKYTSLESRDGGSVNITRVVTNYTYDYWDDAKQATITRAGFDDAPATPVQDTSADSTFLFDANGHVVQVDELKSGPGAGPNRHLTYATDHMGRILVRKEYPNASHVTPDFQHNYYLYNGYVIGEWGNDNDPAMNYAEIIQQQREIKKGDDIKPVTSADFDQNFQPITADFPANAASDYVVRYTGESLSNIAMTVWGDAALWYLIADANGLTGTETLAEGFVLTIPNKVTNIHNNASTFRPYQPGIAIGKVAPNLPNPQIPLLPEIGSRTELAHNISVLEALDRTAHLDDEGRAVLADLKAQYAAGWGKGDDGGCGGFLSFLVPVVSIVAAFWTGGLSLIQGIGNAFVQGAISGAVGSLAGQAFANIAGIQKGFSFGDLAFGALTGGIAGGLSTGFKPDGIFKALSGSNFGAVASRAVVANALNQGASVALGRQDGFSWRSLAASAVGAVASNRIFGRLNDQGQSTDGLVDFDTSKPIQHLGDVMGRNITQQGIGVLVRVQNSISWGSVAADVVSQTVVAAANGRYSQVTKPADFGIDWQEQIQAGLAAKIENQISSAVKGPPQPAIREVRTPEFTRNGGTGLSDALSRQQEFENSVGARIDRLIDRISAGDTASTLRAANRDQYLEQRFQRGLILGDSRTDFGSGVDLGVPISELDFASFGSVMPQVHNLDFRGAVTTYIDDLVETSGISNSFALAGAAFGRSTAEFLAFSAENAVDAVKFGVDFSISPEVRSATFEAIRDFASDPVFHTSLLIENFASLSHKDRAFNVAGGFVGGAFAQVGKAGNLANVGPPVDFARGTLGANGGNIRIVPNSSPIRPNEVTTLQDFKNRSVIGDNVEGHELLQHSNLNKRELATTRSSTDASKNNPVIALDRATHRDVTQAQRAINARAQSGGQNIEDNARILRDHPDIPNSAVDLLEELAKRHNDSL